MERVSAPVEGLPMPKITKRLVDGLGPDDVGHTVRDDDLAGFAVRRNADGSKTYLVEYRAGRGRGFPTRRMTIGKHGALTPDEARQRAKQLLAQVAHGEDPAAQRTARKKELTVKDLLTRTLENHWKPKRRASTAAVFERLINKTLIPEFGSVRLSDLTRSQIRTWHAKQVKRPRAANHELAVLRKALSVAVTDNLIGDNPAKGIELHPEATRDRIPTDEELRAIWRALDEAPIRPSARLLFKLLALTGCRREEWMRAKWSHVDLELGIYALEEGKAGARRIPLSAPTMALLRAVGRSSKWVLPNDTGDGPLTPDNVRSAWEKVREVSRVTDLRIHDLRHAFATRGAALGGNALILRDVLGHKTLAMTRRYVSRQNDPMRELSERIGQSILTVTGGGTPQTASEVVDLTAPKASA